MNSKLKTNVKLPIEMEGYSRFRTVGIHERGAMPKLDFMDRPTPNATTIRPKVEMPYLTDMLLPLPIVSVFVLHKNTQIYPESPNTWG
jgi:hypothetical protein